MTITAYEETAQRRRDAPRVRMRGLPKTAPEVFLVALAVCEARAGGLCPADTASIQTPVHFWLMKAKHLHTEKIKKKSCIYFSFNTLSSQPVSIACSLQYLAEAEGHVSGSDQKVIFYSNSAVCIYLRFSHKRGALKTCRGSGFCRSISPLWPTWGEVGQQSDSVSDRSCHHAARTGCIFGKAKTQTSRSAILHAATHALQTVVKRRGKLQNLWIALPMRCKIIKCVWRWIGGGAVSTPITHGGELWFMLLGKI